MWDMSASLKTSHKIPWPPQIFTAVGSIFFIWTAIDEDISHSAREDFEADLLL